MIILKVQPPPSYFETHDANVKIDLSDNDNDREYRTTINIANNASSSIGIDNQEKNKTLTTLTWENINVFVPPKKPSIFKVCCGLGKNVSPTAPKQIVQSGIDTLH